MRIDIELSPEFHTTRINFRAMERLAMREAGLQVRPTGLMSITSSPFQMLCAMLLWWRRFWMVCMCKYRFLSRLYQYFATSGSRIEPSQTHLGTTRAGGNVGGTIYHDWTQLPGRCNPKDTTAVCSEWIASFFLPWSIQNFSTCLSVDVPCAVRTKVFRYAACFLSVFGGSAHTSATWRAILTLSCNYSCKPVPHEYQGSLSITAG